MVVTMADVQLNMETCNVNIGGIPSNNVRGNFNSNVIQNNISSVQLSKDIVNCDQKDCSSSVISTSDVAGSFVEDDGMDDKCPDIPIPDGPLDMQTLMDLKFIKTILDNLVTPRETRVVLELVVDFIKQETGKCLQEQLDNLKDFGGKLSTADSRNERLKSSLSKYKENLTSIQQKVTENRTKIKLLSEGK